MSNSSLTIAGAKPSEGSSSSSTRGIAIIPRAIDSICCSPPDSSPARPCKRSRRRGNRSSNLRDHRLEIGTGARVGPEHQIVVDGQIGENLPPLGHQREAAGGNLVRLKPGDVAGR